MGVSHWLLASVLLLPLSVTAQQGCSVSNSNPSVPENNLPGHVVTTISLEPNYSVTIDPTSLDASYFTINGSELQLVSSVDYESVAVLLVTLICEKSAVESHSLTITVTIINLNDNSPVFKETNLSRVVPEDAKVNATIVDRESVSASDADLDIIYYKLSSTVQNTSDYFAIRGVNNPEIYLQKALNYEKFNFTTLLLYAMDNTEGVNAVIHTATATINIIIEQADTRSPWFLPCTFIDTDRSICIGSTYTGRVNMSEMSTEPLTLEPGPIYAIDPDYMFNEKIVYSIVGGNADNVFSVDADTGNLTMNKVATSPNSYRLQVMATQVNNKQKYSIANVEIQVINKSNHAPYFESNIYAGTVFVGLDPRSFVFQAGDSSSPLMIAALDDDFPDKVNPNIEYYIRNSTDFIATKDGLILTNVMLQTPGTAIMEAVAKDTVSLQEGSTVVTVEINAAKAEASSSDKIYTAQDMGILGGILAALLLIALVFLGLMIYKQYGMTVKFLINKKFSKDFPGSYDNQAYKQDEHPDLSANKQESPEYINVTKIQQPSLFSTSSSEQEIQGLQQTSSVPTIISDQQAEEEEEEEEEKMEEDTKQEKEVKSILKTDRNEGDPGYKAVWFKTDVDPSGENVQVINDSAADYDDDSDQDLQENEKEEEDYKDDHYRGLGTSLASDSSPFQVSVNMSPRGDSHA
ncbi:cadherin-related family member 5 [Excalfactoria chinensis]|uniref:cadherin-related family member 5 n=1 Tax=Excalfactoria chinensis TaxID=46218 RepID=UPI003B39FFCE